MSLKKAKDYLGNDLQVDSAIKDGKGQVIHQTYINKTIPDGTINKNIGVDSNGDIVKEAPQSAGMTNPMTTAGDIIVGGTSGAPERLAKGTTGYLLGANANGLGWTNSLPILTTAPSSANTEGGLIIVVLSSEPATYYNGYYYIITESNS